MRMPGQMVMASGGEYPFGVEGRAQLSCTRPSASPNESRVVPRPARTRPRHPCTHPGNPGRRD